jgi:hypothetical protein
MRLSLPHLRGKPVKIGDYFCSERDLYRVEQVVDEQALIEDCRTGTLIDVPVSELFKLTPVTSRVSQLPNW